MKKRIKNLQFSLRKKSLWLKCQVQDGFRNRITILRSCGIAPGLVLFALTLLCIFVQCYEGAVGMLAVAIPIKLKKDGLEGENLKFMTDLERRFEALQIDGLTEDKVKELHTKAISDALEPYMKFKGLDLDKLSTLLDKDKGVDAILKAQGEEITKLKGIGAKPENKTTRDLVEEWVVKNKSLIDKIKDGERGITLPELKIKAAITMQNSTSLGGSAFLPNVQVLPGYIDLIRKKPTFWDRLLKPATKANPLVWVNKFNKQGNAEFTAEGTLKSQASFELQTESSVPRKTTEYMKVSTEMLNDVDYLTGMITQELQYEVDMSSNKDVLTGSGVAPHPKGVTLYAGAYTLGTIVGIIAPNNTDAMVAAVAQLRSLNFTGALTAYINPIDNAQRKLSKALTGEYTNNLQVPVDAEIVEDNNIAVGYLLIGDMSKYHVQMYQDFFVQWGWENQDFTKNLVTVIGERRFHQWVSSNETGGFIYDTFANIRTAIA